MAVRRRLRAMLRRPRALGAPADGGQTVVHIDREVASHRNIALIYPLKRLAGREAASLAGSVATALAVSEILSSDERRALGTCLARLGRLEEALGQFTHLGDDDPTGLAANNRGVVLTELYRNEAALAVLAPLAAKGDASRSVLAAYGDAMERTGRTEEAAEVFSRALARWRHDTWFMARLAAIARSGDTDDQDMTRLRRESSRNPGDLNAKLRLGRQLLRVGATSEALELSGQLARKKPDEPRVLEFRAQTLAKAGMAEEATATMQSALERAPLDSQLHVSAAFLFRDLGRPHEGLVEADRACRLTGGDVRALTVRATVLEDLGRFDEAVGSLDEALALDPRAAWLHGAKAGTLHRAGRLQEALAAVAQGNGIHAIDQGLLERKARILTDLGRPREAIEVCDAILAANPTRGDTLVTQAAALAKLGEYDEALRDAERGIVLDPSDPRSYLTLGDILTATGRYEEAISAFDRSYELQPHPFVAMRRAEAQRLLQDR